MTENLKLFRKEHEVVNPFKDIAEGFAAIASAIKKNPKLADDYCDQNYLDDFKNEFRKHGLIGEDETLEALGSRVRKLSRRLDYQLDAEESISKKFPLLVHALIFAISAGISFLNYESTSATGLETAIRLILLSGIYSFLAGANKFRIQRNFFSSPDAEDPSGMPLQRNTFWHRVVQSGFPRYQSRIAAFTAIIAYMHVHEKFLSEQSFILTAPVPVALFYIGYKIFWWVEKRWPADYKK